SVSLCLCGEFRRISCFRPFALSRSQTVGVVQPRATQRRSGCWQSCVLTGPLSIEPQRTIPRSFRSSALTGWPLQCISIHGTRGGMRMAEAAIRAEGLVKRYPHRGPQPGGQDWAMEVVAAVRDLLRLRSPRKTILDGVSLEVGPGELFG